MNSPHQLDDVSSDGDDESTSGSWQPVDGPSIPSAATFWSEPPKEWRVMQWMRNGVERLLFGSADEGPPVAPLRAPTSSSVHLNQSAAQPVDANIVNGGHEPFASVVVGDEPHTAWIRRHSGRLSRELRRETNTSRFLNAISMQHQQDGEGYATVAHHSGVADATLNNASLVDPETETTIDLIGAMNAYKRFPNEFYNSVVQAALAQRGPENPVTGEELAQAAGNEYLVSAILQSGSVSVTDASVAQFIQNEIDDVISHRECEHDYRVTAKAAPYLKHLFEVPSSRITSQQLDALEHSGFEFVKLLHDYPHVLNNIPKGPWWQLRPYQSRIEIDLITSLVGLVLIMIDISCLIAIAFHWLSSDSRQNFGYWTILMYCGGYVVALIVILVFESTKVDSNLYDERIWEYPSSNVKLVPVAPILELMLLHQAFKYYFASRREGRAFFVVLHDLHASLSQLFILHSQCHSFPQILLQSYLFIWGSFVAVDDSYSIFRILLVSASMSVCLSLLLYTRRAAYHNSVNRAGFAVFGSDPQATFPRGNFFPKLLTFLLFFMLEYNAFFFVIALLNIKECRTAVLIWVGIMGCILLAVVVVLILSLLSGKSSRFTARLSLFPLLGQIGFAIYASAFQESVPSSGAGASTKTIDTSCAFYSISLGANVQVGIATFAVMLCVWGFWIASAVWRRYRRMDKNLAVPQKLKYLFRISFGRRSRTTSTSSGVAMQQFVPVGERERVVTAAPTWDSAVVLG